jgi:hypothetical protein
MTGKLKCQGLAALLFIVGGATAQTDGDAVIKGREIFDKYKSAVVTVQLVIKQRFSREGMSSQENEEKTEATGTMIDPTGLTVMSLLAVDPTQMYERMATSRGLMDNDFKMTSEATGAKILLEDGTELEARVVLRDADLDLAFVRPAAKPETPLPYIDLNNSSEPQLLDQIIALNRLGKVARRTYAACFDRIEAIVDKPRTLYVPSQTESGNATLGCPGFTMDGKVVGIAAIRTAVGGDADMLVVLVPAADILDAAKQTPPFGQEGAGEGKAESSETPPEAPATASQ